MISISIMMMMMITETSAQTLCHRGEAIFQENAIDYDDLKK